MLAEQKDVTRKLRALWALHVTGGLSEPDALGLLDHGSEYVRSWAVQLLVEKAPASVTAVQALGRLARQDPSPLVRLYVASALQRVPVNQRWEAVEALLARSDDAGDQNLPLMVWYAAEPLAELDMPRALALAADSKLPRVFPFTVQRIASTRSPAALRLLAERLARTDDPAQQLDLINGLNLVVKPQ
jgi:hypothetical protein